MNAAEWKLCVAGIGFSLCRVRYDYNMPNPLEQCAPHKTLAGVAKACPDACVSTRCALKAHSTMDFCTEARMSNFDHLPDDATRLSAASLRAHFTGHPTLVGWIGRSVLLIVLLGGGVVMGSLLGPVVYALMK